MKLSNVARLLARGEIKYRVAASLQLVLSYKALYGTLKILLNILPAEKSSLRFQF